MIVIPMTGRGNIFSSSKVGSCLNGELGGTR